MKKSYPIPTTSEPIGIVISRGSREEPAPMFTSYVWESIPETSDNTSKAA